MSRTKTTLARFAVASLAALALVVPAAVHRAPASASAWKPGASTWATVEWSESLLETQAVDFASCRGIVGYGQKFMRSFGNSYRRFDCWLENHGRRCHIQYKSVNTPRYGIGTLRIAEVYACDPGFRDYR
jgi:hypothetical protein